MKKRITKRKNSRWSIRVLALMITIAVLIPSVCTYAANSGYLTDRVEHTDLTFGELEYSRMNLDDFTAIIAGLEDLASDAANSSDVETVIIAMEDYYNELIGNYSLVQVYSTQDVNNDDYDEEVKFCDELAVEVSDQIMQSYHTIAVSPCSDVLKNRIDDDDEWQDILDYVPMTDEQKELSAQETDLSLQYDTLSIADYFTTIDGTQYSEAELEEAYGNSTIDMDQYLAGIADIGAQRNEAMGELFLQLVDIRKQIATSYGYDNYVDYAYDKLYGRDYTYEELEDYREQVITYMAPLEDELYSLLFDDYYSQYEAMWDTDMEPEDCLATLEEYLPEISDDLMVSYQYMLDHEMYDIVVSDTKAPGAYTTTLTGYNAPFLFNCADGTISDMGSLIHEFGHYNEMYYASEDTWYYDTSDLDLAEIHSQGLEMLFLDYYDDIYGEYSDVMKTYTLFNLAYAAVEGVKEDEFQYMVYTSSDDLTLAELNRMYYDCCIEYGDEDFYNSYYTGMYGYGESDEITEWVEVPHTFQSPLYYVSYSVSVAAVEEVYDQILDDRQSGIEIYLDLVDREFQEPFQDTLTEVGLNNPIENPRFDVYADNIRYAVGLIDTRPGTGATTQASDSITSSDKPGNNANDDSEYDDTDDYEVTDDIDIMDDDDVEKISTVFIIMLLGAVVLLVVLIVVIVLIVKSSKKKQQQELQQSQLYYGQPMPPTQQYNGQPMQPMQQVPPMDQSQQYYSQMTPPMPTVQPSQVQAPTQPQQYYEPPVDPTQQQMYGQPTQPTPTQQPYDPNGGVN